MQWRDVIIGGIASLVVTVLGGVAIFYATKEPDEKKNEKLIYYFDQSASFSGDAQNFSFSSLRLSNIGGLSAKRILVAISLKDAEIRDVSISGGVGPREVSRDRTLRGIKIIYETVLPQESVTIGLLLSTLEKPNIEIRSEASLGSEVSLIPALDALRARKILDKAAPIAGLIAGLIGILGYFISLKKGFFQRDDRNNSGFLLLHQGLTHEADETLNLAIREGVCHEYVLSNYALCKAVLNDFDKASRFLAAARMYTRSKHGKAIVLFNEGIISLLSGKVGEAENSLKEAYSLSPKTIKKYCQSSVLIEPIRKDKKFSFLFED